MPTDGGDMIVTVIGGGNGSPVILRRMVLGLKREEFSGFVPFSVTTGGDSGGLTAKLRRHGMFAIGDLKRTSAAHHTGDENDAVFQILSKRFPDDHTLFPGLSIGHAYYVALEEEKGRRAAIREFTSLLKMHGMAYAVSIEDYNLYAKLSDGTILRGEHEIDTRDPFDERTIVDPMWLSPEPSPYPLAIETIAASDLVILACGDLRSSLLQIVMVRMVREALAEAKAVVYCVPLMTKAAETRGFDAADYIETLCKYDLGVEKLDAVFVNCRRIPRRIQLRYAAECAEPVVFNEGIRKRILKHSREVVVGDYLDREGLKLKDPLVRHDPTAITKAILDHMKIGGIA